MFGEDKTPFCDAPVILRYKILEITILINCFERRHFNRSYLGAADGKRLP